LRTQHASDDSQLALRTAKALAIMDEKGGEGVSEASTILKDAAEKYDRSET
jgi:hypothetical protein